MSERRILSALKRATGIPTIYRFEIRKTQTPQDRAPRIRGVLPVAKDYLGEEMPLEVFDLVELWPDQVPRWVWSTLDRMDRKKA